MTTPDATTQMSPATPKTAEESAAERSTAVGGSGTPAAPPRAGDAPARIGRYEITATLGAGGFGRVYRASDPDLKREVAVKVPHAAGLTAEFRERFLREARAAATIHHPNVCPIYDIGTEGDLPYLVMHFVPGPTLAGLLGQREVPMAPAEAVGIVRRIALGVAAAHDRGIVHRDLKPQNVLVDESSREVSVTDFGIAQMAGEVGLTGEGEIVGTPPYMSPEQARGDMAAVTALSDVYALGAILYRMVTGETPFHGTVTEVLAQVREAAPRPPSAVRPGLDGRLDALCMKAMAKEPGRRFPSAMAFATALGAFLGAAGEAGGEAGALPAPTGEAYAATVTVVSPATRARRTRRRALAGLVALLLTTAAVVFAVWNPFRRAPETSQEPARPAAPPDRFAGHKFDQATERRAAVWALSLGGRVEVMPSSSTNSLMIYQEKDLPLSFRLAGFLIPNHPLVTDEQIKANVAGVTGPIRINLTGCANITDEAVKVFARIPALVELTLQGPRGVTDVGIRELNGHPTLKYLSLDATGVTVDGLSVLSTLPALTDLSLNLLPVTDEWLVHVAQVANLGSLNLNDTRAPGRITAAGLAHLATLRDLQSLTLSQTAVDSDGLRKLAALPTLETLELEGTAVGDAELAELRAFPRLKFVHLFRTQVTDESVAHLAACKGLTRLFFNTSRITDASVPHFAKLKRLEWLVLMNSKVSDASVEALGGMQTLRHLNLTGSDITPDGLRALRSALPDCAMGNTLPKN